MRRVLIFLLLVLILSAVFIFTTKDTGNTTDLKPTSSPTETVTLPLGKHFMIGHAIGTSVASTTELITKFEPIGVIIMGDVVHPELLPVWIEEWQAASQLPLLIGIDQEGGVVSRLKDGYTLTSQREVSNENEAYDLGLTRGQELSALGITMNFAPVLDSAENPDSFMYDRVFVPRSQAAIFAAAMAQGMHDAGVIPVAKHFPGHDDTVADSHFELPIVTASPATLKQFIAPFAAYIEKQNPDALMTAHVLFPEIDNLPATLSRYFLTDLLREELGFSGIVVTDDISMDAIDVNYGVGAASALSLAAGADIILLASEPEKIADIISAVQSAALTNEDLSNNIQKSDARLATFIKNN